MAFVYILRSTINEITYVGSTLDMELRLREHNSGKNVFTRRHRPWRVVYQEKFEILGQARAREKYLKSAAGRRWLKVNNIIPR
ncbi:MAG: GIY-YIG nuclease family protein [Patescibacteria group bacterium]|nr:GIY-YIG nuclease family protein [Patescibacteria group bacterium]